ncbi:universal stress protein [Runella sp.]|uniref:universal stress protein n=1 Tax=Runella sp. TaxID=1960881 RepID=UPI003D0A7628
MKKILIALDYNPTAQKVAEAGYSLAKAMGAEVILIHVMVDSTYYSTTSYSSVMGFGGYLATDFLQPDFIVELKKSTQDFLNQSKRHLGDDSIQTIVKEGDVADSILETAKELNIDVIVLGSHSQKWLEAIVLGSVTENVLHHTLIPLYIIPTKNKD